MVPFNCKACGNPIDADNAKFCPSCGADVTGMGAETQPAPPAAASVPCPNCGHINATTEGQFCQQCGAKLMPGEAAILDPVPGQTVAATPYVPPNPTAPVQRKSVAGATCARSLAQRRQSSSWNISFQSRTPRPNCDH